MKCQRCGSYMNGMPHKLELAKMCKDQLGLSLTQIKELMCMVDLWDTTPASRCVNQRCLAIVDPLHTLRRRQNFEQAVLRYVQAHHIGSNYAETIVSNYLGLLESGNLGIYRNALRLAHYDTHLASILGNMLASGRSLSGSVGILAHVVREACVHDLCHDSNLTYCGPRVDSLSSAADPFTVFRVDPEIAKDFLTHHGHLSVPDDPRSLCHLCLVTARKIFQLSGAFGHFRTDGESLVDMEDTANG